MKSAATYIPIDCDLHDFLEISCLYGYSLKIELEGGEHLDSMAIDTEVRKDKSEWLIVEQHDHLQSIRMDSIISIKPMDTDARFGLIDFKKV